MALVITDRIEGCDPDGDRNLYIRKKAIIRLADGTEVTAWMYEFANPEKIADHPHLAVDGSDGLPVHEWR